MTVATNIKAVMNGDKDGFRVLMNPKKTALNIMSNISSRDNLSIAVIF